MRNSQHTIANTFLKALLALSLILNFSGCYEEYLQNLDPEQRALLERLIQNSTESESTETSEAEIQPQPLLQSSSEQPQSYSLAKLADDDACSSLSVRPPRGLACLHCSQAEAGQQARLLSSLLFRSCLKNVAVNHLVDGTFSFDEEFLSEQISLLTSNGRRLFLYFYLSNGSTQRRWNSTLIASFGTRTRPEDFREAIQNDPQTRAEYQSIIERLLPVLRFAQTRGAVISLIPMLEDNLDSNSFAAMLALTIESLPSDMYVAIGRNPCPNCWPGNSSNIPQGIFSEKHHGHPFIDFSDGLLTNDGTTYLFPLARAEANATLELEQLRETQRAANQRNNAFILWSAERQGLPANQGLNRFQHPSERNYAIPTFAERRAILSFLREE